MFTLPRGTGASVNVPLSSAAWETSEVIERLVYRGEGSLFIGSLPSRDLWPELSKLRENATTLLSAIDHSNRAPLERAKFAKALEDVWLAAQQAEALPLGFSDDRHIVTIAGARSGKGRSAIVPNLCLYPGSVVVIDPKGENASLTAVQRSHGSAWCEGLGQNVFVLDPFHIADVPDSLRAGLNPLDLFDITSDSVVDDVAALAEALVVSGGAEHIHWDESAKNFIKGLTLYLLVVEANPTLFTLRKFLAQGNPEGWRQACEEDKDFVSHCPDAGLFLLHQMSQVKSGNDDLDAVIIGCVETLAQCGPDERGSILSNARRNTAFLDTLTPTYREAISGEGRCFEPSTLKGEKNGISVFLCLPASRMATHSRWLRVVLNLTLERLQSSLTPPASKVPVLFVLDEFFTLGKMPTIENAAGFAAGFGIKLWLVLQDLQQLKALYPNSWQTFLANAGMVQVFGASDADTCEYVSKMLGEIETRQMVQSVSTTEQSGFGQRSQADRLAPTVGALGAKQAGLAFLQAAVALSADDQSISGSGSRAVNVNEQITMAPLLRPDEVAQQFSTDSGAALVMIKGRRPIWLLRVNYDQSPWFAGRYTPLAHHRSQYRKATAQPFGERASGHFAQCIERFNALVRAAGMD